jgi:predicted nucleic acid-binding protein
MKQFITDASFLISAIRDVDRNHDACYTFFKENEDSEWIIPTIAYFEYQATQSRLKREGEKAYRELYIPNPKIYPITHELIKKVSKLDLAVVFEDLRGADLICACIAKIEEIPLITCDSHFNKYQKEIALINSLEK